MTDHLQAELAAQTEAAGRLAEGISCDFLRGPMVMPRNELYPSMIDSRWPHQIRLPEDGYAGKAYEVVLGCCRDERLSLCPRGHSVSRDAQWFHVFCFAEREHAGRFKARFGGEWFNRKTWNDEERAACMALKGLHKMRGRWVPISKSTGA